MVGTLSKSRFGGTLLMNGSGVVGAELRNKQQSKILSLASMHV